MAFDLGSIVNGIANSVLPGVASGGGYVATDPPLTHEPAHAQLAETPVSNPAAGSAERQGIIIIGGDVPLHPAVAAAVSVHPVADPIKPDEWGHTVADHPRSPGNAGGGLSGLLHTIANLGSSGGQPG